MYTLRLDRIHESENRLLMREELPKLAADVDVDAYDRKVLETFVDAEGRIRQFPAQRKKMEVLVRYALKAFEPGVRYTEKQVNEILERFNEDVAYLRRSFIEMKLMARESNGSAYWRTDA